MPKGKTFPTVSAAVEKEIQDRNTRPEMESRRGELASLSINRMRMHENV